MSRNCPICGGTDKDLLYKYKLLLPEGLEFMPSVLDIAVCNVCGMTYTSSEADQQTYDKYYETIHAYTKDKNTNSDEEDSWIIKGRKKMLKILERHIKEGGGYIVDVGTGTGGALQILKEQGFTRLLGIDVDDKKEMFSAKGLEYEIGNVFRLPDLVKDRRCGLFILNSVLEHIFDVRGAMDSLWRAMDSESRLYIMVPDAERYLEFFDKPYRYFGIEHINHFSSSILSELFRRSGFDILEKGKLEGEYNQYYTEPDIYFVLQKNHRKAGNVPYVTDAMLRQSLNAYIQKSREGSPESVINRLRKKDRPLAVWGVGSYLMGILENTKLLNCNIEFFVDNNESLQRTKIKEIEIKVPQALENFEGIILVASAIYSDVILEEIKQMGIKNEVYVL